MTGLYSAPPAPEGSLEHPDIFLGEEHSLILEVREAHALLATPTSTPISSLQTPGSKWFTPTSQWRPRRLRHDRTCARGPTASNDVLGWTPAGLPVSTEASPVLLPAARGAPSAPRLPQGGPGALPSSLPLLAHWELFFIPHFSSEGASS